MFPEVTARLRPRTGWESQDLGLAMVRGMIGRLLVQWLVVLLPIWAALTVLLWDRPVLLLLIVWWLKPAYDRLPLFSLGRRLFGQETRLRDFLRAVPKLLFVGNIYFLTFGRFSFYRSFSMPVKVLEGGAFSAYRRRVSTLLRVGDSTVFWVTFAWFVATVLGVIGCYLFLDSWSGESESASSAEIWARLFGRGWRDTDLELWRTIALLYMFVVTITEPFYVGSGFGLYINARSHLEGWDIEVAFRTLAARISQSLVPLLLCGLFLFQGLGSARAQDDPQDIIKEIKAHPDFKIHQEEITVDDTVSSPSNYPNMNLDTNWLAAFGSIATVILWGLLIAVVIYLIYLIVKNRHLFMPNKRGPRPAPEPKARVVLGLDVTAEALPADIAAAARERWLAGDIYGALRLLYAGSLSWMIQRASLPIRESDTEGDCVRHSKKLWDPNQISYFQQLTNAWVRNAYGKKSPQSTEMEQFVTQWPFLK